MENLKSIRHLIQSIDLLVAILLVQFKTCHSLCPLMFIGTFLPGNPTVEGGPKGGTELFHVAPERRVVFIAKTLDGFEDLIDILSLGAVAVPDIPGDIPALTRDPKDDYLLACAVVGQADYIVTGDDDLLVLKEVEGVRMVSAGEFWQILTQE